jgi:ABC-type dipeptide/oligopeptide/nickel transport system permease subunit
MLAALQQYHVLASYWWMYIPGLMLIPVFLTFSVVANEIHRRVKSA